MCASALVSHHVPTCRKLPPVPSPLARKSQSGTELMSFRRDRTTLVEPSEPVSGPPSLVVGSNKPTSTGDLTPKPNTKNRSTTATAPFPCGPAATCVNRPAPSIKVRAGSGSGIPLFLDCSKHPGPLRARLQTNPGPYLTIYLQIPRGRRPGMPGSEGSETITPATKPIHESSRVRLAVINHPVSAVELLIMQ